VSFESLRELHKEIVALFHLAQNLVQAQRALEGLKRFARLRVIGYGDTGLEKAREQLPPTDIAASVAVGHGGIACDKNSGGGGR
jgi:hypothetical protein